MTLQGFIKTNIGKFIEVAGSPGAENQCVDLANAFLRDVLNHPIVEWTNARDFPSKLTKNFIWIPNTPEAIPQPGDIMIWQHNKWGHVGIFIEGNINSFRSFDQNYPTGTPAHIQKHNYLNPRVAGWLRSKNAIVNNEGENMPKQNELAEAMQSLMDKYGKGTIKDFVNYLVEHLGEDGNGGHLKSERDRNGELQGLLNDQSAKVIKLNKLYKKVKFDLTQAKLRIKELEKPKPVEAIKDPVRYVVSLAIGALLTWAYSQYPVLGELGADQQAIAAFLVGLVIKSIDKYQHESGSNIKLPF